ncbi:MAG: hypothetical protein ACOY3Y_09985 [Acidobacteriota bacterium]
MLPYLQCLELADDKIVCGCPTHVNAGKNVLLQLDDLKKAYILAGCPAICPAIPCPAPGTGVCTMTSPGGSGTCTDKWP